MTWLPEPEAWIISAVSTMTWFWIPDTTTLLQWPVITTLLVIPLTLTVPPLQAMVRVSLIPETVMFSPAGALVTEVGGVGAATADVLGTAADAVGLIEEKLGADGMVGRPRVTWCALKAKIATGRAIMPNTNNASRIQRPRPCRPVRIGGL